MEMASGCPRRMPDGENEARERAHRPVRGPHGGWQPSEIDALRTRLEQAEHAGESLRSVFEEMGERLGRKPNSIRNYYYAQLRGQGEEPSGRTLPFETFSPQEIEQLIRDVLIARAQGLSVRACVRRLSAGDKTRMLRYQNKYRSVVRTRPELVHRIMRQLREEGIPFVSPYPGEEAAEAGVRIAQMKSRAACDADSQLSALFSSLEYLLSLAFGEKEASPPIPQDDDGALRRADRLRAQCDMLRIALDDEQTRAGTLRAEAGSMVTLIKEYIALPEPDRLTRCSAFCCQAAERLSAVECAMMEE